jgi:Ca-activated chloride channel family protein
VKGFSHPEWLMPLSLLGAALACALLFAAARAGRRRRTLLGQSTRLPDFGRDLLAFAALAAIGLALLGPRIGERTERVQASGVDVVLLLDVSRSMDARDVAPSRLDRARRNAELVLSGLEPGDRAALAAFADVGVLLTPLTADRAALADMLPSLDADLMRYRGSSLGAGIHAALAAFEPASVRPRVLLLLGDGEDPERALDDGLATAEALRADVRIVAAAIGSERGANIPDHGVPLRDAAGELVRSRADAARLAVLAAATGGRLLPTDAFGAIDVAAAVGEIRRDAARGPGDTVMRRVPAVRTAPFAALAFALVAAGLLQAVALRLPSARARRYATTLLGLGLVASSGAGLAQSSSDSLAAESSSGQAARSSTGEVAAAEAYAAGAPRDPETLLRLGVARARAGLGPEAERAFLAAALYAREPAVTSLAYFDLGVAALERDELETARDAFFDALAFAPRDEEARFNLEWTLRALSEAAPPPPAGEVPAGSKETDSKQGSKADPGAAGVPASGEPGASGNDAQASGAARSPAPGSAGKEAAASEAGGADGPGAEVPALEDADAERWLRAVQDDPGRALRDTARRAGASTRAARQGPGW